MFSRQQMATARSPCIARGSGQWRIASTRLESRRRPAATKGGERLGREKRPSAVSDRGILGPVHEDLRTAIGDARQICEVQAHQLPAPTQGVIVYGEYGLIAKPGQVARTDDGQPVAHDGG